MATIGVTAAMTSAQASGDSRLSPSSLQPPSAAAPSGRPIQPGRRGRGAAAAAGTSPPASPQAVFAEWAGQEAARTGVPARALEAYAAAAQRVDAHSPSCHLSWATLAGIGYVESRSGQLGAGFRPSGRPRHAIYGVQLDGAGPVASVPDSDNGELDADPTVDRAVGPLQFLPSTWMTWAADGDGNGVSDPQDIDDAALSAAEYLCASGDLSSATGWASAVLSYNRSNDYLAAVYSATEQIAVRSEG